MEIFFYSFFIQSHRGKMLKSRLNSPTDNSQLKLRCLLNDASDDERQNLCMYCEFVFVCKYDHMRIFVPGKAIQRESYIFVSFTPNTMKLQCTVGRAHILYVFCVYISM